MKSITDHLIIVAIIAVVLVLVGYVCWHLWRVSPAGWKWSIAGVFIAWMASFFAAFIFNERLPIGLATVLYEVGNTWLIASLYFLIIFLISDLATICHVFPKGLLKDNTAGLVTIVGAVAVILSIGGIHYHHKYREELTITTTKPLDKPLTIVMASDLHLGYHNRRNELSRWVDLINAEHPDIVLFGGDLIDMSLRPVVEGRYDEELRRIEAPVLAVLGNHEFYGDLPKAEQFYAKAGITLLKDSVVNVKGVDIVGRMDRTARERKPIVELMDGVPADSFTILLDHQPYNLEEAEKACIDFQFSGHTHRGQVWPLSWVTDAMYEKAWGHYWKGNTQYYVSSGLGIWGAKVRIGSRSEYLVLHVTNLKHN